MKVLIYACLLFIAVSGEEEEEDEGYTRNNYYNLTNDKIFYPNSGMVFELYNSDGEIRNILVPPTDSLFHYSYHNPGANHPPLYFNLYKNGKNDGVYLLKNKTARKIMDGTDSTTDFSSDKLFHYDKQDLVYVSASDGIYTFNPNNEEIKKFGNITEEFKAIDKVNAAKDEIYVLAGDNKIYKITSQGTVKTKVDGIDYATNFIVNVTGSIYYLDENNKPRILYEGSTKSESVTGLNFDVKNAFLCRIYWNLDDVTRPQRTVDLVVDGVSYVIFNKAALPVLARATVPGLTSLSHEWGYVHFYGEKGRIYMHDILARDSSAMQQKRGSAKDSRKEVFDRDALANYNAVQARVRN